LKKLKTNLILFYISVTTVHGAFTVMTEVNGYCRLNVI